MTRKLLQKGVISLTANLRTLWYWSTRVGNFIRLLILHQLQSNRYHKSVTRCPRCLTNLSLHVTSDRQQRDAEADDVEHHPLRTVPVRIQDWR